MLKKVRKRKKVFSQKYLEVNNTKGKTMRHFLKVLLSAFILFGTVPTLQADNSASAGMEEIKKKKKKDKKKGKASKGKKGGWGKWKSKWKKKKNE